MKKIYLLALIFLLPLSACTVGIHTKNLKAQTYYANLNYLKIIKVIKTPKETAYYLKTYLHFKRTETCRSFKYIHNRKYGQCAEYAVAAAALLSDNNYPPLILHLYYHSSKNTHALFIYQHKKTKKWGVLASEKSFLPVFENPKEICVFFNKIGFYKSQIIAYNIHDLSGYNFIDGDEKDIYKQWHKRKKILLNEN